MKANFGDLDKAKKDRKYKIGRTTATIMFFVTTVVIYVCHSVIGFPLIAIKALKFFGKIIGSAFFNATYKDFAYDNSKEKSKLSQNSMAEVNPEARILMEPETSKIL